MRMALPPPTLRFGLTSQNMAAIVQYETRWPWVAHWVKWGCLCHADPQPATIFRWRCFKCYRIFNCQDVWCWNRPWFQCFDASLFLMMNEKKPTWTCPVCDSPAKYDDLMVDGYFQVWIGASVTNGCRKFQLVQTLFLMTVVMLVPQEVIKAEELPDEENEIILNQVCVHSLHTTLTVTYIIHFDFTFPHARMVPGIRCPRMRRQSVWGRRRRQRRRKMRLLNCLVFSVNRFTSCF